MTLAFVLMLNGQRGLVIDYPCGSLVIVISAVLVLSCGKTDTQTDADIRFTPATVVGVSNCGAFLDISAPAPAGGLPP